MTAAEPRELRCAVGLPIPTPVIYPSVTGSYELLMMIIRSGQAPETDSA